MLQKLKRIVSRNLINIPGWRTDRKIVVFESDDWGSIRMPSKEAYDKLLDKGIRVDNSIYDKFDILEQRKDLVSLFEILSDYKDIKRNPPIFTFNTVMGNPSFEQIEDDGFDIYHHEDIEISYKKYNGENILDLWDQAIEEKLIHPQFHAKEHLNVSLWMEALRKNYDETRIAFNHKFFGLKTNTPSPNQKNYLAAYWAKDEQDYKKKIKILKKGLKMFLDTFGFPSKSFVACNYIYPEEMERFMLEFGINYIQTQRGHISPNFYTGKKKVKRNYTGQVNRFNQYYLVRNCFFEPTLNQNTDSVTTCLKEMEAAFKWNKPAIISSHRINYVGGMSIKNRDRGLINLDILLSRILKKWPDIEFFSTDQLGNLIGSEI